MTTTENTITVPAPGTLGWGAGKMTKPELLREGEDPFRSVVWFPMDAEQDAKDFVAEFPETYVLRENVPL